MSTFLNSLKKSTFLDTPEKSTFLDSKSLLFRIWPNIESLLFWTPKSRLFWTVLECRNSKVYFFGCNPFSGRVNPGYEVKRFRRRQKLYHIRVHHLVIGKQALDYNTSYVKSQTKLNSLNVVQIKVDEVSSSLASLKMILNARQIELSRSKFQTLSSLPSGTRELRLSLPPGSPQSRD